MASKYVDVDVITTIRQTVEVPEDYDKQEVLNFLASQQSFRDAFVGLDNDAYDMVIREVEVIDEEFDT